MAPSDVTAQPRPLPLPGGGGGGGGGGGSGGEGEGDGKCKHCDKEFAEKAAKCLDTFDKCTNACPPCKTRSNCDARKPCAAPCNIKFSACKEDANKERKQCKKGC